MITPKFSIDQTETQLIITLEAPYTNVKKTEIHVEGDDVRFYSAPYYLRLTLPGNVEETDHSSAKYISDENKFVITLDKSNPGEEFIGLDLITTLLQPKGPRRVGKPIIEVMEDEQEYVMPSLALELTDDDWYIDQMEQEPGGSAAAGILPQFGYGFANSHKGLGDKYEVELSQVAEIENPDSMSLAARITAKDEREQTKFSDDHYLSDFMLENDIPRLLGFQFDLQSLQTLTKQNLTQMKNFGNREFLLDKSDQKSLCFGMIDIMFAYCYDWRTSEGFHSVESAWNISKMSGTLSWFVSFDSIVEVVVSSLRRSLSYPLSRNWELSMKVFQDTLEVLKTGIKGVLVCLLDIYKLFNERDPYYLLNQLYIEEYCIWIQKLSPATLTSLASTLEKELKDISKAAVRFDLPELEVAARLVEDEEMEDELSADVQNINI